MPPINQSVRFARKINQAKYQNPLLPIMAHVIDRGLKGTTEKGEMDKIFDQTLAKYPRASRAVLGKFVTAFNEMDTATKTRVTPSQLQGLKTSAMLKPAQTQLVRSDLVRLQPSGMGLADSFADRIRSGIFNLGNFPPSLRNIKAHGQVTEMDSFGNVEFKPGQSIDLVGFYFASTLTDNTINIYSVGVSDPDLHDEVWKLIASPKPTQITLTTTPDRLTFILPTDFPPNGSWVVKVKRKASQEESNGLWFYTRPEPPPPLPKPEIFNIEPKGQHPGQKVILTGKNFTGVNYSWFVPLDGQIHTVSELGSPAKLNILSDSQIEMTLPLGWSANSTFSGGNYAIHVMNRPHPGSSAAVASNAFIYNVLPCTYRVIFEKMHCIDESDPEWAGGDEIATFWTVVADDMAWAKSSKTYENFDDNDWDTYTATDQSVYKNDGTAAPVEKGLAIRTMLVEIDADEVESANQTIGFFADLSSTILTAAGQVGWAKVVEYGAKLIQWFNSTFLSENDVHGTRDLYFYPGELQGRTNNPSKSFTGKLDFFNSDDDGSYELFYKIVRVA